MSRSLTFFREMYVTYMAGDGETTTMGFNVPLPEWEERREGLREAGFNIVAKKHRRPISGTPESVRNILGPSASALGPPPRAIGSGS